MLVFPYLRVSTQEQAKDGFSISAQKKRLTAFAQSQEWDIYDFYVDEGLSAKDMNRPDLKRLIHDIQTIDEKDKVVLVFKLDRLTRSVMDLYKLIQIFEDHNTAFRSATEVYDTTTAMGRLFITLVGALAQFERENIAERVRMGMEQMVYEGKWHGSTPAYGFDYVEKELVVNESEAAVVRKMFDLYRNGMGDNKMAKYLNHNGHRTKSGEYWSHTSVGYVLQNPIYIGILRWNFFKNKFNDDPGDYFEVSGFVPEVVDKEKFYTVQRIRKEKAAMHPRQASSTHPFSGKMKCGRCEAPMKVSSTRQNGKQYVYYECLNKRKGLCNLPKINKEKVETYFLRTIRQYRDEGAAYEVAATRTEEPDTEKEIRAIQNEIKKIQRRKKKWQLAFADEAISIDDLRARTAEDKQREAELQQELQELTIDEETEKELDPEEIASMLEDFEFQWNAADDIGKKMMIQVLVEQITVDSPHDHLGNLKFKDRTITVNIEFK